VPLSFDIFCRVIDNYGDIGVCWRLARQLASRADCGEIRLWTDDLASFARIAPDVAPNAATQIVEGVTILRWDDDGRSGPASKPACPRISSARPAFRRDSPGMQRPAEALPRPESFLYPADIVIEAFACAPPAAYVERMTARQLWINLEYLSAEDWVESCHGLPSMQANGLRKFFFFPGFTPTTGGLLREPDLLSRREAWRSNPESRLALLERLGVEAAWLERLRAGAALIYVYCYPQAPLPALMDALSRQARDTLVLLPEGIWPGALPNPPPSGRCLAEACVHPFVDQDSFDRLLWSSDLNIVRGEDSLVRAIWAGLPLIWQPYPQEEDAHLEKLRAWLTRTPFPADVRRAMLAWNHADALTASEALRELLRTGRLKQWEHQSRTWCAELAQTNDLATRLLDFCARNSQTR